MKRNILGPRIRERRRELGITQVELARRIEISASYLNLIEHNKRVIGGALLGKTAQVLDVSIEQLDGAQDRLLLHKLEDIAHGPEMHSLGVEIENAGELIGRFPGWARAVAALDRSEREAREIAQVIGDRLNHDPFLGDTVHKMLTRMASLRSAVEIVDDYPDLDATRRDRFHHIIRDESCQLGNLGESLAAYFDNAAISQRTLTPLDEIDRLFDKHHNHFADIEVAAGALHAELPGPLERGRQQAAAELAEQVLCVNIDRFLASPSLFDTELAKNRCRELLLRYATLALLLPLAEFKQQAQDLDYDIERLSNHYNLDFEIICERLSALPNEGSRPSFGYYQANAAGTILKSRNLPDFSIPHYGSICPLWILFRAQQSTGELMYQYVSFPSGVNFVFIARLRRVHTRGFGMPRHFVTDMLVLKEADALPTVYRPDTTRSPEAVGVSCRTCNRDECAHRVVDPLLG